MNKGFKATLIAAAFSFAGLQAAYSAAPVISDLPDFIRVGDAEPIDNPGGSDNNFFVFTNAFQFSTSVHDPDTADIFLKWSFAEYSGVGTSPDNRYSVNGVAPVAAGTTAVGALDLAGGPVNPGANRINSGAVGSAGDYATFRDVIFSPPANPRPYPNPGATQAADAALGKTVRFYVSDDEYVTSASVFVTTVDNALDEASSEETTLMDEIYGEKDNFLGWQKDGIDDGPEGGQSASLDTVDATTTTQELTTIVRVATSRQRLLGFRNFNIGVMPSGTDKYIRGKFYLYVTNPSSAAVNTVPGFRVRIDNGNAVLATINVLPAQTGNTGPTAPNALSNPAWGNVPFNFYRDGSNNADSEQKQTRYLRPSGSSAKPSLYRVDMDPVNVAPVAGSPLSATFQAFAAANPTAGNISMTECVVLTYPALTDAAGNAIFTYDRRNGSTDVQQVDAGFGRFNADNDFRPGYRQYLQLGDPFDSTSASSFATMTNNTDGLTVDTTNCPVNQFGVALLNLERGTVAGGKLHNLQARVQPGKLYRARFYTTSNIAAWSNNAETERQAYIRFRFQATAWNSHLELNSPIHNMYESFDNYGVVSGNIMREALPSATSTNADNLANGVDLRPAGHGGGWYTVLSGTPLDDDIRPEVSGSTATKFGDFFNEPGPGVNSPSYKTITLGVDVQQQPRQLIISGDPNPDPAVAFFPRNRGNIRVHRVVLYEYNQLDDGGYAY